MCLTWSCVTGLHEKLPVGTRSHLTKLLHSFWSLSSGTVSQIVPGGRLIWSFQKLLTCPRFCNSNMSKTKGCLPPHPPSASVAGNTEICHTYDLELSTWQLPHTPSFRHDPCLLFADLCLTVLHCCSYRMLAPLNAIDQGENGGRSPFALLPCPTSVSSLFYYLSIVSTNGPFDIFLPVWGTKGSWLFVG